MKILAVRGRNLTSLAHFDLDFEAQPFDGGGLFAIVGHTGAGKSTLLDAVCVALYDASPRLNGPRDFLVGGPNEDEKSLIGNTDPRTLLRRGTTDGWAEVDFEGVDGGRYRSRWAVRRARGKVDGALQDATLSLTELEGGQPVCQGGKRETLAAIQARVGLDFVQFRRAVLLAQGDFAAFLKAPPQERAELLERATGTDIYQRLSKAAFERAKGLRTEVESLQRAIDAIPVLPDEARAEVERDERARADALKTQRDALSAVVKVLQWHATLADLRKDEAAASEGLAMVSEQRAQAGPREARLRAVEAAQPLRGAVERCVELESLVAESERLLGEETTRREQLAERLAEAVKVRDARQLEHTQAVSAREAAAEALDRAAALDARLGDLERRLTDAEGALNAKQHDAAGHARTLADLRTQQADAERARSEAETWLAEKVATKVLTDEWSRWEAVFDRYVRRHGIVAQRDARVAALDGQLAQARQALAPLEHAASTRATALGEATERLRTCRAHVDGLRAPDRLAADEGAALGQREGIRALTQIHGEFAACGARAAQMMGEAEQHLAEAAQFEASAASLTETANGLSTRLDEARVALSEMTLTLSLESHRASLREGHPCPLCGATEHPYAAETPALNALLDARSGRVRTLEAELGEAQRQATEASSRAEACRSAATALQRKIEVEQQQANDLAHRWQTVCFAQPIDGLGAAIADDGVGSQLEAVAARVDAVVAALRDERAQADQSRAQAEQAARVEAEARAAHDDASRRLIEAQERVRALELEQSTAAREGQAERDGLAEAEAELAPAFPAASEWRVKLTANPVEFKTKCADAVEKRRAREQAKLSAEATLTALREKMAAVEAETRSSDAAVVEARGKAEAAGAERDAARSVRATLLGGRATDAVRSELARRVQDAEVAFTESEKSRQAIDGEHRSLASRESTLRDALSQAMKRRDEARVARDAALAGAGLTVDEAVDLLRHDAAFIAAERDHLTALDAAVNAAKTLCDERRARREQHAQREAPGLSAEEAEARHAALEVEVPRLEEAANEAHVRRRTDDQRRDERARAVKDAGERREQARVWIELSDLIGSADGKRMQVFAQGLTLDLLVAYANEHLGELARRYRLMRVPHKKEALALQVVDLDMGDEVRSVDSLSGGETFLVSLALALGLSSLSAQRARIDSLFIDEGFGSLDAETLETALAALESLQATGRQIGLISHVPGISERVGAVVRVERQGAGRSVVRVSRG